MPRIIETTVYEIEELSAEAKEKARNWYRDTGLHDDWYDCVYEDFETICGILGVTLQTSLVRLYGGGVRHKPHVYFQGFNSQGDGASFEGSWSHARGSVRGIRAHAPQDEELHRIADVLQDVQRRNFFQLEASIRQNGRYCHENTMTIEVERESPVGQPMTGGAEAAVIKTLRDLARWLYRQLECEYTHITSDEAVDETIAINMWTFTAGGERFG